MAVTSSLPKAGKVVAALVLFLAMTPVHPVVAQDLQDLVADSEGHRRLGKIARLQPSATPSALVRPPATDTLKGGAPEIASGLDALIRVADTRILIISWDRRVIYERYAEEWLRRATPLGYSMSKSLAALTMGKALCTGAIGSLQQKGATLLPDLEGTSWGNATIEQILRMQSGSSEQGPPHLGWQNEAVTLENRPIYTGRMTGEYKEMMRRHDERRFQPGQQFQYNNYDTLALGLLVEAATGRSFADFFNETIWQPLGPAGTGAWLQNNAGQTATHGGFSAAPDDWVRLGHFVIDSMRNKDDCFARYLEAAVKPGSRTFISSRCYGYQIWNWCSPDTFMFFGFRGQYLVITPRLGVVMYAHQGSGKNDAAMMALYQRVLREF